MRSKLLSSYDIIETFAKYPSKLTATGGYRILTWFVTLPSQNFPPMALFNVSLLSDHNKLEKFMDDKISSSSRRISLLGKVLREPKPNANISRSPLVIGLTGGICSGKTHIMETLESLGACCISADLLGHETYKTGTLLNQKIVDEFGAEVRTDDGTINRKALGAVVFTDSKKRERLNELVWPEIEKLLRQKVGSDRLSSERNTAILLFA